MKKNGFSLAELFVITFIIGVMVTAGISTYKTYDKGIRYILSNTYYALDRALFNATTTWINEDEKYKRVIFEDRFTGYDKDGTPQTYVYNESNPTEGARRLCVALTHYITPVEAENACSPTMTLANLGAEDSFFKNTKPAFTAINGVRFWITKRYPSNIQAIDENKGARFYVIYADMNGERIPNSVSYAKGKGRNKQATKDPDIFAFAAFAYLDGTTTTAGRVIPIGIAEIEPRYLTSRIRYYGEDDSEFYSVVSRPIVTSKKEAWDFYSDEDKDDTIYSEKYKNMINVPFAYGDYIRKAILAENDKSNIYAFLKNNEGKIQNYYQYYSNKEHTELNKDGKGADIPFREGYNAGGYGCEKEDPYEEHCKVFIDKYFH